MSFNCGVRFTFLMQGAQSEILSRAESAAATKSTGWSLRLSDGGTGTIASIGGFQDVPRNVTIASVGGVTAARSLRYFSR